MLSMFLLLCYQKTNALISCAVTVQLISAFAFDNTIPLLPSLVVQRGLCRTWLKTQKASFLMTRLRKHDIFSQFPYQKFLASVAGQASLCLTC